MLNSRMLNKSTGALNELGASGRSMSRQSPAPPHHSLFTSTPQPQQRSKARSMHALNDQDRDSCSGIGSVEYWSNSPPSVSRGNSSDNSPTSSPFLSPSSRSNAPSESSLRSGNLTDDFLHYYGGQKAGSEGNTPVLHQKQFGGKTSPSVTTHYGTSAGHRMPTNRRVSSPASSVDDRFLDHPEGLFTRTYSYARATRDHPVSLSASPLAQPYVRPVTQRVSDMDDSVFGMHSLGSDRKAHPLLMGSASSSPHYHSPPRAHSTISMTSSGSSTPPAVGRSQSMLTRPERYMRRTPFMDPHQEALEMVDPLVSLRSQAGGASEGTYV